MAKAHCAICEACGYRSCDKCGGVVFELLMTAFGPRDICTYCEADAKAS